MSEFQERGIVFKRGDNRLVGIITTPEQPSEVGVLFLAGGPQYRAGSHRQFTLLARSLAAAGIASLRFDYSGMGDSEGSRQTFNEAEGDMFSAIEIFCEGVPPLSRVILWGLCDAASTAMMFGHRFPQVSGMILLNPWVHGGECSPDFTLSQYYRPLLTEKEAWRRLLFGQVELVPAIRDLAGASLSFLRGPAASGDRQPLKRTFVQEMLHGVQRFKHGILIILSEDDFTAKEFSALVENEKHWKAAMSNLAISITTVSDADHTFSRRAWQEQVTEKTIGWLR